ncbi:MAG: prolyl oligopeptidase family serine peptidase [Alistipes sp.]|jgi:predicted peptidase|nr:prolyl oligopeptidase family serine peptidase [Alistipes sp.]
MKKLFLLSAALFVVAVSHAARPDRYEARVFDAPGGVKLNYRVLLPDGYDSGKEYPLLLFMHGAGERGDDNVSQLIHGSGVFTNPVNMEKYPAVVLFPQCPKEDFWALARRPENGFGHDAFVAGPPETPMISAVLALVESFVANEKIDAGRVYVMGLSMGGMATFDLVCRRPDLFAAAVPICGGVNVERLQAATRVPMRIYHGDKDPTVPVENSRSAYLALKQYGAKRVEYIEFPGVDHNSWDPAFNTPDFLKWIFKQHK